MLVVVQVVSTFLVSVAMALSLSHALELPGKMRLDKKAYFTVQPIALLALLGAIAVK
jgi:hypothetical protein